MSKKFKFILYIILVVAVILLSVFTPLLNKTGAFFSSFITPIQTGITVSINKTGDFFKSFGKASFYQEKSEQLQKQIDKLETTNNEAIRLKKENESLRELLKLEKHYSDKQAKVALVIAKDAGNWFNVFTINKGEKDNIVKNSAVFNEKGLIGRVENSTNNSANVVSIIDATHSVSGVVSRTGDLVQIDGDISLAKKGLCKMTVISDEADIMIGDSIETSGVGGIYPKGIMIGIVREFKNNEDGTGKYAIIAPYVDFQHIYEVLVINDSQEVTE